MSDTNIGLILEYVDTNGNVPMAKVYWTDNHSDTVVEVLKAIMADRRITKVEELEEIVDLVDTDGQMQLAEDYL